MIEHMESESLHKGRHELTGDGLAGRRCRRRAVAYLADFTVVDGAAGLFKQKAVIDGYALGSSIEILHYIVDSGEPAEAGVVGHGLERLLRTIRRSGEGAVLVEHVSRFAIDYAVALRVAAAMSAWGITVHEARGGPVLVRPGLAADLAAGGFGDDCSLRREPRSFPACAPTAARCAATGLSR